MQRTKIAWCTHTWNPVTGCTKVSEGCRNCYAEAYAQRFNGGDFSAQLHPERLYPNLPRKPAEIFICSMSDLFHLLTYNFFIDLVYRVIMSEKGQKHQFFILTKRPQRALVYYKSIQDDANMAGDCNVVSAYTHNLWFGVTCENPKRWIERWPIVSQIPAHNVFVSIEPLLCDIDMNLPTKPIYGRAVAQFKNGILQDPIRIPDQIIVGCESGPNRRPCKIEWVESIAKQCDVAGVPLFIKQLDINGKVEHNPKKFPKHLQKYGQLAWRK